MNIPKHIQAVIFDMDGVIIDSEPYWDDALIEMFRGRNRECPKESLKDVHGMGMRESSQLLKDKYGIDGEVDALIAEKKEIFYSLFFKNPELLPGAEEIIIKLHEQKMPIAIATMGHYRDKLKQILSSLNLSDFFAQLVTSEDIRKGKPHPDIYLYTAEKLGINPKVCLVIEDASNGVLSGKAAGMTVYGVNSNAEIYKELQKAGADHVFKSLAEVTVL